jgi:hypothetical protein
MENTDTIINIENYDNECPICLISLNDHPQDIVHLKCCKKNLHVECYIRCMSQKKECPMCRNNNKNITETHIFPPLQVPLMLTTPQYRFINHENRRCYICRYYVIPTCSILFTIGFISYSLNYKLSP